MLRNLLLVLILIVIITVLLVPIDYQIKGPGRLIANAEWTLVQLEQDKLQSNLIFQGVKKHDQISLFHFDRPDYINISMMPNNLIGDRISAGDVMAKLVSAEDKIRLSSLQGELDEAQASLASLNTGAKEAFQIEGQQALHYAKSQVEAHQLVLDRQKELFQKQLISEQELETSQAQYELLKINVSLQQARLQATKTGEKMEEIAVIEAEMRAAENQINVFRQKLEAETIKVPIDGILVQPDRALGELCHICNLDTIIIQMPIKASEVQFVKSGMPIEIHIAGLKNNLINANVHSVDRNAMQVNGQPMYLATAMVVNENDDIHNGMTGYMKINAGRIGPWTLLNRAWNNFQFNR